MGYQGGHSGVSGVGGQQYLVYTKNLLSQIRLGRLSIF